MASSIAPLYGLSQMAHEPRACDVRRLCEILKSREATINNTNMINPKGLIASWGAPTRNPPVERGPVSKRDPAIHSLLGS